MVAGERRQHADPRGHVEDDGRGGRHLQGPDHHARRRGLAEERRGLDPAEVRPVRQRAADRLLSGHGRPAGRGGLRLRPGRHRRALRRRRGTDHQRRLHRDPEDHQAVLQTDRALCLRGGETPGLEERRGHPQEQHPEEDGRRVPRGVREVKKDYAGIDSRSTTSTTWPSS